MGPRALPMTAMLPQTPMAMLRSRSSSNVTRINASVAGIIAAAPTASTAREAISRTGLGENAAISEAAPKMHNPMTNIRRCPTRSPSVPAPRSRPAMTTG